MDYTADGLITKVKRIAAIPVNAPGFDNTTILSILNDELLSEVVPFLVALRGEWLIDKSDTAVNTATEFYDIPSAAIGGLIRDVQIVHKDSDAFEADDDFIDLMRVDPGEITRANYPCFAIRGDRIQIPGIENYSGDYIRFLYWRRPNDLQLVTYCRQIATIGTGNVTVATVPTSWGSSPTLDLIDNTPPFRVLGEAITTSVSSTTITGTFTGAAVGDWLALTGYSPVAQIPDICYPYLVQSTALKVLETYPDAGGLQAVSAKMAEQKDMLRKIMEQRVEGAPQSFAREDDVVGLF